MLKLIAAVKGFEGEARYTIFYLVRNNTLVPHESHTQCFVREIFSHNELSEIKLERNEKWDKGIYKNFLKYGDRAIMVYLDALYASIFEVNRVLSNEIGDEEEYDDYYFRHIRYRN